MFNSSECSLEQAIADFLQVEQVKSNYPENAFFLGKTYLVTGNRKEARKWIQKVGVSELLSFRSFLYFVFEFARFDMVKHSDLDEMAPKFTLVWKVLFLL